MKHLNEFRELLQNIRRRPQMYLPLYNYETLVIFFTGIEVWQAVEGSSPIMPFFPKWLSARNSCEYSLHWSTVLSQMCEEKGILDKTEYFFECMVEFLNFMDSHPEL